MLARRTRRSTAWSRGSEKTPEEIEAEVDALNEEEIQEAIEEVRQRPEDGKVHEVSGLTAGQIRLLSVPLRVKMARNADRQLRSLLVRDQNAQVALTVLRNNTLNDQEVELIANSRSVVDEVLAEIPKRREWIRKYAIAKAWSRTCEPSWRRPSSRWRG